VTQKSRKIVLEVEPGIEDGTVLRLRGEGNAGMKGGPRGDLIVVVHQKPHRTFLRRGNDVFCEIPITIYQALLGAEIKVPTLDGKLVKISIPAGTQSGKTFRLKKEGIPYLKRWGKGDQLVKTIIRIPKSLSATERKLLQQIRGQSKETDAPALIPINQFE
jgi:molecular chaperone DnaJ